MPTNPSTRRPIGRIGKRNAIALGVFALFAGMLFWTKLRVVESIPRSAYAVPGAAELDEAQANEPAPQRPEDESQTENQTEGQADAQSD